MKGFLLRGVVVVVGLVVVGTGIGSLFLADLGVGPWDVLHDALADRLDRRPGTVIIGVGVVLFGVVVLLRQPIGPGTVANVAIIGSTVNALLALVDPPSAMAIRVALVVAAPLLMAFGSMLYIGAGLGIGVRDGIMTALGEAGLGIGRARTLIEGTVLVVGALLGGSWGIGTLVFAVLVGPALQWFQRHVWAGFDEVPRVVYRRR